MDLIVLIAVAALIWLFAKPQTGAQPQGTATDAGLQNIATGIAKFEGFFVPGSVAARTNNPGNIGTFGGKTAGYDSADAGWGALDTYITSHAAQHPDWNFYDFFHYYLTGDPNGAPGPNQNPDAYAEFVAAQAGVDPTIPVSQAIGAY